MILTKLMLVFVLLKIGECKYAKRYVDVGIVVDFSPIAPEPDLVNMVRPTDKKALKKIIEEIVDDLKKWKESDESVDAWLSVTVRGHNNRDNPGLALTLVTLQPVDQKENILKELEKDLHKYNLSADPERDSNIETMVKGVRQKFESYALRKAPVTASGLLVWIVMTYDADKKEAGAFEPLKEFMEKSKKVKEGGPEIAIALDNFHKPDVFSIINIFELKSANTDPVNKLVDSLRENLNEVLKNCEQDVVPTECYYTSPDRLECFIKVTYSPSAKTNNEFRKYCSKGMIEKNCEVGGKENLDRCKDLCITQPKIRYGKCSVTCGNGEQLWRAQEYDTNPVYANCEVDKRPCSGPSCTDDPEPKGSSRPTGAPQPGGTSRFSSTTTQSRLAQSIASTGKPLLEMWQIGLIAVGCITVLTVVIGVAVCIVCRKRKRQLKHIHPTFNKNVMSAGQRHGPQGGRPKPPLPPRRPAPPPSQSMAPSTTTESKAPTAMYCSVNPKSTTRPTNGKRGDSRF